MFKCMQNIQNAKQNSSKRNYFIDNNGNLKNMEIWAWKCTEPQKYHFLIHVYQSQKKGINMEKI